MFSIAVGSAAMLTASGDKLKATGLLEAANGSTADLLLSESPPADPISGNGRALAQRITQAMNAGIHHSNMRRLAGALSWLRHCLSPLQRCNLYYLGSLTRCSSGGALLPGIR
jgi:hypothetical protein